MLCVNNPIVVKMASVSGQEPAVSGQKPASLLIGTPRVAPCTQAAAAADQMLPPTSTFPIIENMPPQHVVLPGWLRICHGCCALQL
jgi:hypothetical protein